jgi:hypothetical protein
MNTLSFHSAFDFSALFVLVKTFSRNEGVFLGCVLRLGDCSILISLKLKIKFLYFENLYKFLAVILES